jgi:hypothetical protein
VGVLVVGLLVVFCGLFPRHEWRQVAGGTGEDGSCWVRIDHWTGRARIDCFTKGRLELPRTLPEAR